MAHNDPNDSLDALKKTLEQTNRSVSELTRAMSGLGRAQADRFVFKIPDEFVKQVAEGTVSRIGANLRNAGTGRFVGQLRETGYAPSPSAENQKTLASILKALENPKPCVPSSVEVQSLFVLGEISSRLGMLVATTKVAKVATPTPTAPKEYYTKSLLGRADIFIGDILGGISSKVGSRLGKIDASLQETLGGVFGRIGEVFQGEARNKVGSVLGSIFKPIDNYLGQVARNIGEDFSRIGEVFQGSVGRKLFGWLSGGSKAAPPTGMPALPAPPKELQIITLLKEISARLADIASKTGGGGAAGRVLGFKELADFVAKVKEIDPQDFIAAFLEKVKGTKPQQIPLGADYEKAAAPALPSLFQPQLEIARTRARRLLGQLQPAMFGEDETEPAYGATSHLPPLPRGPLPTPPPPATPAWRPPPELMSSPDLLGPLAPVPPTPPAVPPPPPWMARPPVVLPPPPPAPTPEEARLAMAARGVPGSLMGVPTPPPTAVGHALAALEHGALAVPPAVSQPIPPAEAMPQSREGTHGLLPPRPLPAFNVRRLRTSQLRALAGIGPEELAGLSKGAREALLRRRLSRMSPEELAAAGLQHEETLRQHGLWEGAPPPIPTFPPIEAFPSPRGEDRIPAMLTAGEAVLTPEQAAELGLGGIEASAGGGVQYLASGTGTGSSKNLEFLTDLAANLTKVGLVLKFTQEALGGFAETVLNSQKRFDESGAMSVVHARMEVFEINRNRAIGDQLAPSAGKLEQSWEQLESKLTPYLIEMLEVLNTIASNTAGIIAEAIEMGEAMIAKAADNFDSLNLTNKKMLDLWIEFVRRGEIGNAGAADRFMKDLERDFMDRRSRKGFESGKGAPTLGRPAGDFLLPGVPRRFPG